LASASKTAPNRGAIHPFDEKYGTDTAGYLGPEDLATGQKHDAFNYGYSAIAPSVFREACRRWRETLPAVAGRVEAYSFVDVGAGKGRALLLASELAFRRIIGVELNPDLARTALRNLTRRLRATRSKTSIRAVQEDALNFRWPRPPLLVYLYNPFDCSLIARLAEKLAALSSSSASSLVDILYVNPTCSDALTGSGAFSRIWTARIHMDEADRKADPYGTATDVVSAYRCTR
jgi:SAM-dependent methyltransferase